MGFRKSRWLELLDWLQSREVHLPKAFPSELPPESSLDFWFRAAQIEMLERDAVSAKIRLLIRGQSVSTMTALETWLYQRRVEWAAQLALAKVQKGVEPNAPLSEVLEWALISSWESDGCIALWNHAERGGKAHPQNPEGLSPV